jgi:flagellar motility protein MotE (MotC chaperone)
LKSVRLLPVVIFAALALLLFKGVGLVTNGGYILTGPAVVLAAGGEGEAASETGGEGAAPTEPTMTDTSPTLDDGAPTLATKAEAPAHAEPSETLPDPSSIPEGGTSTASEASSEAAQTADVACPATGDTASAEADHASAELTDNIGDAMAIGCPPVAVPVNEHGDALPLVKDGDGKLVPLEAAAGDNNEEALVGRLSERRAELDKREADIAMRTALLEAAEKRLDERTQALAALEAKVAALVDEKQAAEEEGFKAVVSMYEGMKPKDAAKIFDTLSMQVLLKVARAMSPRKMSPILAAMSPDPAQKLTTAMAATENTDVVTANAGENLAQLPQIVGQ